MTEWRWNPLSGGSKRGIAQNIDRRDLSGTLRAILAEKLQPLYAAEAKKAQPEGQKLGGQTAGRGRKKADSSTQKVGESKHGKEAAERAAKAAKTNRQYVADVKRIKREAPHIYAKMEAGEIELPLHRQAEESRASREIPRNRGHNACLVAETAIPSCGSKSPLNGLAPFEIDS